MYCCSYNIRVVGVHSRAPECSTSDDLFSVVGKEVVLRHSYGKGTVFLAIKPWEWSGGASKTEFGVLWRCCHGQTRRVKRRAKMMTRDVRDAVDDVLR